MIGTKIVGNIGENLVCDLLGGTLSDDEYDGDKDLIDSEGKEVEVKTQVRYRVEKCFTIPYEQYKNNYRKCLTVERLVFVEYELDSDKITIWECMNRRHVKRISTARGAVLGFSIGSMKKLKEIYDENLAKQLRENTQAI